MRSGKCNWGTKYFDRHWKTEKIAAAHSLLVSKTADGSFKSMLRTPCTRGIHFSTQIHPDVPRSGFRISLTTLQREGLPVRHLGTHRTALLLET